MGICDYTIDNFFEQPARADLHCGVWKFHLIGIGALFDLRAVIATQMILDVHIHNQGAIVRISYRDKGVDRLDSLLDIDDKPQ